MVVAAQLSLNFPGGKCVTWKNRNNVENEGKGYHLQTLLYLTYNTNVFVAGNKNVISTKTKLCSNPLAHIL